MSSGSTALLTPGAPRRRIAALGTVPGSAASHFIGCALSCVGKKATNCWMPRGRSAKPGKSPVANGPGERRGSCGTRIAASIAAHASSPCPCLTRSIVVRYGWWWCDKAKDANRGICSPMNRWRRPSKPGTSPFPTFALENRGKLPLSENRTPDRIPAAPRLGAASQTVVVSYPGLWLSALLARSLPVAGPLPALRGLVSPSRLALVDGQSSLVPPAVGTESALANPSPPFFGLPPLSPALSHYLAGLLFSLVDHPLAPVRFFVLKLCSGSCHLPSDRARKPGSHWRTLAAAAIVCRE